MGTERDRLPRPPLHYPSRSLENELTENELTTTYIQMVGAEDHDHDRDPRHSKHSKHRKPPSTTTDARTAG